MSLTIQGNTVPVTGKVTVNGNECNTIQMYGSEVWKKDEWETLFSGSWTSTSQPSMDVSGLKVGDTVTVSATAKFVEAHSYAQYEHEDSITRQQLPTTLSLYSYTSFNLTVGDGKINIEGRMGTQSFKGETVYYAPISITITEVRRKK